MGNPEEKSDVTEPKDAAGALSVCKVQEMQDIVEKEFVAFPDITADVINALLYQGREVVQADKLLAGPTESIYQGKEKLRTQYEDLCKYEMSGSRINLMYLIANQSRIDGKMLLRKAGYIGGAYRDQYEEKVHGVFPVIEMVLYWGNPRWKSSCNTRQLFRWCKLTEDKWKYIDEFKLHVFEMRHLNREERELFQSDMRIVVDFLAEGNTYRSNRKIMHKSALIKMIKVLSGETDIEDIEEWLRIRGIREEDEFTVCELFDQYERKGRIEGRVEGRAKGKIEGENRFAKLVQILMDSGRNDDLRKAASDQEYREGLYQEVGLA